MSISALLPTARLRSVDFRVAVGVAVLAAIHFAAIGILLFTEYDVAAQAAFILAWIFVNCFWLTLLGRPLLSGALSLALAVALIALSHFKYDVVMMTVTFIDVMLIDLSTFSFLLRATPGLASKLTAALIVAVPFAILLWRLEPFRVRRSRAAAASVCSLAVLAGLSLALPLDREDEFYLRQYVSKFAR